MMTENNEKDKRFSNLLSTVDKGKVLPDKQFLAELREQSANEFEAYSAESKPRSQTRTISIWRIIMKNRITKLAAAAVIIIAAIIGINQFGGSIGTSGVAFGEVLEYFQTFSYTFDLTVDTVEGSLPFTMQAMVWELGRMRVDCSKVGMGRISSVTDFNAGRTLLLFHDNKTGAIKKEFVLNKNTGAGGVVAFCTKPIENLWSVRDGTEEQLGEKEIDGQKVAGFRIFQEDQYFEYDITIWADAESGVPILVEAIAKSFDESYPLIKWTMENFDLEVELDEELFSLDVPEGYTLAYQEDLEKLEVETELSAEAKKILQMLELWAEGKEDEAIELLLAVDWTRPMEFGKEPYIFSISEEGPNSMLIMRLVGIAIERNALKEMIDLYTTTNNQQKLKEAEDQLRAAEAVVEKIKKQATGQ